MSSVIGYLFRTWLTTITFLLYVFCFAAVGIGFFVLYQDFMTFLKTGSFVFTSFSRYTDGVFDSHINASGAALSNLNTILIQAGDTPAAMVLIACGICCLVLLIFISFITPRDAVAKK